MFHQTQLLCQVLLPAFAKKSGVRSLSITQLALTCRCDTHFYLLLEQCRFSWSECVLIQPKTQRQAGICLHRTAWFHKRRKLLTQCKAWGLQIAMTCAYCSTCCEFTVANRSVSAGKSSAGATSCMQRHAVAFLIFTARAAAAAVGDERSSVCYILHIEADQPGQANHKETGVACTCS